MTHWWAEPGVFSDTCDVFSDTCVGNFPLFSTLTNCKYMNKSLNRLIISDLVCSIHRHIGCMSISLICRSIDEKHTCENGVFLCKMAKHTIFTRVFLVNRSKYQRDMHISGVFKT